MGSNLAARAKAHAMRLYTGIAIWAHAMRPYAGIAIWAHAMRPYALPAGRWRFGHSQVSFS